MASGSSMMKFCGIQYGGSSGNVRHKRAVTCVSRYQCAGFGAKETRNQDTTFRVAMNDTYKETDEIMSVSGQRTKPKWSNRSLSLVDYSVLVLKRPVVAIADNQRQPPGVHMKGT